MERNNNKIIYLDNGQKFHFFHSDKEGLCMIDADRVQVLLKNACADYDVCRLESVIYLVCQSHDGDIILLKYFSSAWHKSTLLVSKVKQAYDKHFYLLITGACMQLFYTIKSSGRLLLIQQILCNESTEPVVVASVADIMQPFYVLNDNELNTYIYYQNEHSGFGFKMYKWSSKALGDFTPVTSDICSSIYAIIDLYGRHHICCMCHDAILYIQRTLDGEYVKQAHILCTPNTDSIPPHIRIEDEKIYIMWQQQRSVMYTLSADDGVSFCAPVRILSSGEAALLFSLQNKLTRTLSFGYFSGDNVRFLAAGTNSMPIQKHTLDENKRFIKRKAEPVGTEAELERIKMAIAALGKEVSELKTKLELITAIVENKYQ